MKEFQEYTGRDLYDYCCGYILKRESIWNGSAVQYSDQIEKKIKGVLKRCKAGSYNADRTAYIQKIIGEMQVEVLNFSGENPSKFYIRKENTEGYAALDDADIEGKTSIPLKAWKAERDKLNGEKKELTRQYYALKDEVKEVEQIRRNVYSILMEENGREHPTRKHEHER